MRSLPLSMEPRRPRAFSALSSVSPVLLCKEFAESLAFLLRRSFDSAPRGEGALESVVGILTAGQGQVQDAMVCSDELR